MSGEVGVCSEEQCEDAEDEQGDLRKLCQRAGEEDSIEDDGLLRSEDEIGDGGRAADRAEEAGRGEAGFDRAAAEGEQVDGDDQDRRQDDDDFGQCEVEELGVGDHHAPPRRPTNSGELRAGVMTFSSICGYRPMATLVQMRMIAPRRSGSEMGGHGP